MSRGLGGGVLSMADGFRAARALVLAGGLAVVGVAGAGAQATPQAGAGVVPSGGVEASPATGPCEAPDGMPGMEIEAASPEASPVGGEGVLAVGTPVEGDELADDAEAAVENFANCWNAGDVEAVLGLVTLNFVQAQYGVDSADAAAELLGEEGALPEISLVATGDVLTFDDGRASIDLDYLLGPYQYTSARWYMVEADGQLLIDEQELTVPQPDVEASSVIGVGFVDDETGLAFDAGADDVGGRTIPLLPAIIVTVGNTVGTESRIVSIVRLDEAPAGTPEAGDFPEDGGEFVAMFTVAAGGSPSVALVNLSPGSYVVGEMGGDSVPLTITEPEEVEI